MNEHVKAPLPTKGSISSEADPKWIWCRAEGSDSHAWVWARQQFFSDSLDRVYLEITADLRYDIWINGRYVGFGPARFHAPIPTIDVYDVSEYCREGSNGIVVRIYSLGAIEEKGGISSAMPQRGALWVRLSCGSEVLVSDEKWRMNRDPAYASETASRGETQPPNECYDARRALGRLWEVSYADEGWPHAKCVSGPDVASMELRDIPFFPLQTHLPDEIVETGILEFPRDYLSIPISEVARDIKAARSRPFEERDEVAFCADYSVQLSSGQKSNGAAYAVWDFGRIWTGYPVFTFKGSPGTIIECCYSEHLTEGRVDPSKSGINYFDRVILSDESFEHQITWPKCARYAQIVVHGGHVDAKVAWKRSAYPLRRLGGWSSNRPVIDHAVEISLHTVQLCMEDTFMDTPWRERGAWLGDDLIKARACYIYFGDFKLARRFLLHHSRGQEASGELLGKYPSNIPHWVSTWTLRYPDSLLAYCQVSDDWELALHVWPTIQRLVDWILSRKSTNGLLVAPDVTVTAEVNRYNFIDWAPVDMRGANAAWNAFAYRALTASSQLAERLENNTAGSAWKHESSLLRAAFQSHFWDEDCGVFVNGYHNGERLPRWGAHENTLALLYGLATEQQEFRIIERLKSEDLQSVFVVDEADYDVEVPECGKMATVSLALSCYRWPSDRMVPIGTAYFAGYWLEMLSKYGMVEDAQRFIEDRWGEFAKQGGTTVWETWTMKESLSHGWSCSPAVFAAECFAGIQLLDSELPSYRILPSPGKIESFRARFTTRLGVLQVAFKSGRLQIDKPDGVVVYAGLPLQDSAELYYNDERVDHPETIIHGGISYSVHLLAQSTSELRLVSAA